MYSVCNGYFFFRLTDTITSGCFILANAATSNCRAFAPYQDNDEIFVKFESAPGTKIQATVGYKDLFDLFHFEKMYNWKNLDVIFVLVTHCTFIFNRDVQYHKSEYNPANERIIGSSTD